MWSRVTKCCSAFMRLIEPYNVASVNHGPDGGPGLSLRHFHDRSATVTKDGAKLPYTMVPLMCHHGVTG